MLKNLINELIREGKTWLIVNPGMELIATAWNEELAENILVEHYKEALDMDESYKELLSDEKILSNAFNENFLIFETKDIADNLTIDDMARALKVAREISAFVN